MRRRGEDDYSACAEKRISYELVLNEAIDFNARELPSPATAAYIAVPTGGRGKPLADAIMSGAIAKLAGDAKILDDDHDRVLTRAHGEMKCCEEIKPIAR